MVSLIITKSSVYRVVPAVFPGNITKDAFFKQIVGTEQDKGIMPSDGVIYIG